MDAFTIASAVLSIVLSVFAIWLSIVFYRMSVASSDRIQEASKELGSNVSKLENLFDHLYSDTFSLMRDTYSDMRKHVWPEVDDREVIEQVERRADRKIADIRTELMRQIETITARPGEADVSVEKLHEELSPLVDQAISRSRSADTEAREETLHDFLKGQVRAAGDDGIPAVMLLRQVRQNRLGALEDFFIELQNLKDEHAIDFSAAESQLISADDLIHIRN